MVAPKNSCESEELRLTEDLDLLDGAMSPHNDTSSKSASDLLSAFSLAMSTVDEVALVGDSCMHDVPYWLYPAQKSAEALGALCFPPTTHWPQAVLQACSYGEGSDTAIVSFPCIMRCSSMSASTLSRLARPVNTNSILPLESVSGIGSSTVASYLLCIRRESCSRQRTERTLWYPTSMRKAISECMPWKQI